MKDFLEVIVALSRSPFILFMGGVFIGAVILMAVEERRRWRDGE